MKNYRGTGDRVTVKAAAGRTSGQAVVEQNWHGFAETSPASEARYAIKTEGEFEMAFITSSVKWDRIDIKNSDLSLVRVAYGTAPGAGFRPFATVVAVPGDGETGSASQAPKTGFMWVKLLPQNVTQA
jgi:predicted RecA/RadA family phage recombinase